MLNRKFTHALILQALNAEDKDAEKVPQLKRKWEKLMKKLSSRAADYRVITSSLQNSCTEKCWTLRRHF